MTTPAPSIPTLPGGQPGPSREPLSPWTRRGLLAFVIFFHVGGGWALTQVEPVKLVVGDIAPMEVRMVPAAEPAPPDIPLDEPPPPEFPKPELATALDPPPPDLPPPEFPVEAKPPEPPKPPEKKPPPPKPQPPKPDRVDALLDDILKNKQSNQKVQTPEQQPKPVQQITRQAPAAPNLAAVVTASDIEGVRQKIRPCWNTQGGARDQAMIITLVVDMNQNGTPVQASVRDTGRYHSDAVYRAAADAAWRAIMNPRCQPWPLSPEKYNSWKTITFNFDPRDY